MWVAYANTKATHIFSAKNISVYAIFNNQNFIDTLTNNIVSFEQLGPGLFVRKLTFNSHAGQNYKYMFGPQVIENFP